MPTSNQGQYRHRLYWNQEVIYDQQVDSPLGDSVIRVSGWKSAWLALRNRLVIRVEMSGSLEAIRVIQDSDYASVS
jgi:hypothetical protein